MPTLSNNVILCKPNSHTHTHIELKKKQLDMKNILKFLSFVCIQESDLYAGTIAVFRVISMSSVYYMRKI